MRIRHYAVAITTLLNFACMPSSRIVDPIACEQRQLTSDASGHCINSTQCFSPDGSKIVYDTRNEDSKLAANGQIRMIDVHTGEDVLLYQTTNQSEYGPGVGAATFSPGGKYVLFLGGIQNASKDNPYSFTRRTGIAVAIGHPGTAIGMDARDMQPPYTRGALRGGTHAHSWSGDGQMISFTYNDHVLAEAARTHPAVIDTRTVGILFPQAVTVPHADGIENKNGEWFAALITRVTQQPQPGSDEISKAFDECWIGTNGYSKADGSRQHKAIAFQGHVVTKEGETKTSIFVADIPADMSIMTRDLSPGTGTELPAVPSGITQRRITGDEIYVSPTPRHWLRSTPDGSLVGFLAADASGIIQLWGVSPNGGAVRQLTYLSSSITGPFNFSYDGKYAACMAGGIVYVTRLSDSKSFAVTSPRENVELTGAVVWSPAGHTLAVNGYVQDEVGKFLQVFLVRFRDEEAG